MASQAHTLAAIHIVCFVSVRLLGQAPPHLCRPRPGRAARPHPPPTLTHRPPSPTAQPHPQVGDVQTAAVATGIGNTLGNKGGVGLRCSVGSTSLLFVNAHLSAHQHAVAQRNADFHRIEAQLPLQPAGRVSLRRHLEASVSERGFDALVWLGDLNYRIDANRAMVDALLAPADERARAAPTWRGEGAHWEESRAVLLANDQLRRQMAEGAAFAGYSEGEILFHPTYKFDSKVHTEYDRSEKQRIPAYTDRVLYRGGGVELLRYAACESLLTSDNRPVTAEFRLHYHPIPAPARTDRAVPAKSGQTSSVCAVM